MLEWIQDLTGNWVADNPSNNGFDQICNPNWFYFDLQYNDYSRWLEL